MAGEPNIFKLLTDRKPHFQLESSTSSLSSSEEVFIRQGKTQTDALVRTSTSSKRRQPSTSPHWCIRGALHLRLGGGVSTVIFAAEGCEHTCIIRTPSPTR